MKSAISTKEYKQYRRKANRKGFVGACWKKGYQFRGYASGNRIIEEVEGQLHDRIHLAEACEEYEVR